MNIIRESATGYTLIPEESYFLDKRRIFLEGEITNEKAIDFVKKLLYLANDNLPVQIFINSPGGSIEAGRMILDVLKDYPCEIETYCLGQAYSMAAIIFILAKNRYIFESSKIMLHEPLVSGSKSMSSATEIKELSKKLEMHKIELIALLSTRTGKTPKFFTKEMEKDTFYTADECIKNNFADHLANINNIKEVDSWNSTK